MSASMFQNTYIVTPEWHLTAIFNTIQLLFGVALFLGGKSLNKIALRVRNAFKLGMPSNMALNLAPSGRWTAP